MKNLVLIDAGHGAFDPIKKIYTTGVAGNGKFFDHKKGKFHFGGTVFYEGLFNREMGKRLETHLTKLNIPFENLAHEWQDTPLKQRTDKANILNRTNNCLLISLHGNAANGQARGFSIWTTETQNKSDVVAENIWQSYKPIKGVTKRSNRTDGDNDYEAGFWMLTKSAMPAVLIEHLFFDNYEDACLMMDAEVQEGFVDAIVEGIKKFFNIETVI